MFYDYHVHTHFSEDGEMSLDEACVAAIKGHVREIAITDHVDIDYPDRNFQFNLEYDAYSDAISKANQKYKGRLNIIMGLEIGLQPHILDECEAFIEDKKFEFIIASLHAVSRKDLYSKTFYEKKDKRTAYTEYLRELLFCIENFEMYDVLGHIDIIRRYGDYKDNSIKYTDYADLLDAIFKELILRGKGIEINTSGFRYGLEKGTMPDFDLLKRYRELGGEILTIGSDAHKPCHMAAHFALAHSMAKEAGFKYLTRFPLGKPEFLRL